MTCVGSTKSMSSDSKNVIALQECHAPGHKQVPNPLNQEQAGVLEQQEQDALAHILDTNPFSQEQAMVLWENQ